MSVANVTDRYQDLGLAVRQSQDDRTQLGQDDFLRLMTAQLQNQDPFKPMENGEFLGQIAQFSTVSGIQEMQASLSGLTSALTSNQTLQAATLVGRGVRVPSDTAYLFAEGGLSGAAELPSSGALTVEITDASGQVVRRLSLGTHAAGSAEFSWDGLDDAGERLPEGRYGIRAQLDTGSATSSVDVSTVGLVRSVSLGSDGLSLNLYGMDPVRLDQVSQIL
jgi:flagellar basal-body rod modification protein FlgD